jgi:hypothetical protein
MRGGADSRPDARAVYRRAEGTAVRLGQVDVSGVGSLFLADWDIASEGNSDVDVEMDRHDAGGKNLRWATPAAWTST